MVRRLLVVALLCTLAPGVASADHHRRFPARKASAFGGIGTAPIAFYVCSDTIDFGTFAKPELASKVCKNGSRRAIAAYGPYVYPTPKRKSDEGWFSNRDYPYETFDKRQFSRSGYVPTP
jgi:hypothetical protein